MEPWFVFVYGTLRQGEMRNGLLAETSKLVYPQAAIRGFDLYHLGGYPGIVPGEGRVIGEMYEVPQYVMTILDRIEGTDLDEPLKGLYRREEVEVFGPDAKAIAWVYIYNHLKANRMARLIPSGDWLSAREV